MVNYPRDSRTDRNMGLTRRLIGDDTGSLPPAAYVAGPILSAPWCAGIAKFTLDRVPTGALVASPWGRGRLLLVLHDSQSFQQAKEEAG